MQEHALEVLRFELRLASRWNEDVSHYEARETGKGSSSVWEWVNSVSKQNRGKGLRVAWFWKMFENVMWKEGDGDRMAVEILDEVEGMFPVWSTLCIYRTPLAMLKE